MSDETPEINVGALSEALNDKADLDMNNIPSATLSAKIAPLLESLGGGSSGIVEQGKYDTGGYCLWENGLLIQWLNIPELKHNTVATYTWWKPFSTNTWALVSGATTLAKHTRTTSGFKYDGTGLSGEAVPNPAFLGVGYATTSTT